MPQLSEMLLHFSKLDKKLPLVNENQINRNYIVGSDEVIRVLDRSNTTDLLKKYRLSLAEKYDSHGMPNFFKYGIHQEIESNDLGGIFQWTTMPVNYTQFLVRLLLIALSIIFVFGLFIGSVVCCCMRNKYQKKIKAERALVKAYGLDQRSLNYNDAISGYINAAFESSNVNGMLTLPGTNVYAYEGSNPIWLRKYDNVKPTSLSQVSLSSKNQMIKEFKILNINND